MLGRASHAAPRRRRSAGQAVTEFALVTPILLILVVGVGDFGRLLAAGITLESASRDAAEAGSSQYIANPPAALNVPAPPAVAAYYQSIHTSAAQAVCAASRQLPGVTFDSGTATCPGMPLILVCVHDGQDPLCGTEANGAAVPAQCQSFQAASLPSNTQADGKRRYVEVRTCFQFQSVISVPLISLGNIWLERSRNFDVPCYFTLGPADCG